MKRIFTLAIGILFLTMGSAQAQGNWVVADQSVSPSSPINSCLKASVAGSYTWLSFNTYVNDNHLAQLSYALPPALDILTGTPSITDNNGNPIPGLVVVFTPNSGGYTATFGPGTTFAPGFKFIFRIDSLDIMDNQSYTNQQATHSISFVSAPSGESFTDNLATVIFNTTQCSTPLSVNFLDFSAQLIKENTYKAKLNWIALADANFKSFAVEKSRDAVNWTKFDELDAKNGIGQINYETIDKELRSGLTYYRIIGINSDGNYSYSEVKNVNWKTGIDNGIAIYPNPAKDIINVDFEAELNDNVEIKIHDMRGRTVKSVMSKSNGQLNNIRISLGDLSEGVYSIELYNNSRLIHVEKINKLD